MDDSEEKPTAPEKARDGQKLLTGKQWFAIVLAAFTIVLTAVVNIGVREYYQPDVRYEEGTWYYSGASGIVSLRIKNYGAADAEKIVFTAAFEDTIKNASVNDPTVECQFKYQDPKTITGTMERLVPKQTALVYFDVSRPWTSTVFKEGPFLRNMIYNGGTGKTGEPPLRKFLLGVSFGAVLGMGIAIASAAIKFLLRKYQLQLYMDWTRTNA